MTLNWQDSDALVHAEIILLDWPSIGRQGFESPGERNGVEIKIDSMQKDGTQSWIGYQQGVGKHVKELSEENKKTTHSEKASSSTERPVAM